MSEYRSPRVAIVELHTDNHYGFIDSWVQILQCITSNITIFARSEFEAISSQKWPCTLDLSPRGQNIPDYLKHIRNQGDFDWVVFTTFEGYFLKTLVCWPRTQKVIICIHNANRWFSSKKKNLIATMEAVFRFLVLRKATAVALTSSGIREYVQTELRLRKPAVVVPFGIRSRAINRDESLRPFTVVVPGSLSQSRRRYDRVLCAAAQLPSVRFVILGGPNSKERGGEVLRDMINSSLSNLVYFDSFVDEERFASEMQLADLVLSDLHVEFSSSRSDEVYGLTKDSGVSYLMIEYRIPGLFNQDFNNLPELKAATLTFESVATLVATIQDLMSRGTTYQVMRESAIQASLSFTAHRFFIEEIQPLFQRNPT